MKLSKKAKREGGFTLIELIAVIIILGILAAVIVPKYFDMTSKAREAAIKGAVSEGVARFNMAYSQYILNSNTKPADSSFLAGTNYLGGTSVSIGDYTVSYTSTSTSLTVTASGQGTTGTTTLPWPN